MRTFSLLTLTVVLAAASIASAQVTFDFEGVTLADLETAGWTLIDDQQTTTDPNTTPPTTQAFLGTLQIETTIVHSGTQALRLGLQDIAYFPLNGEFGTLDLWAFDFGYRLHAYLNGGVAYGPRFGLQKFDAAGYGYGIGGGYCDKSYLDSDDSYAIEWGNTQHWDLAAPADPPHPNAGWAGDQSWWSPYYLGWMSSGRPVVYDDSTTPTTGGGWNHWRIAYLSPGVVEIEMLESWDGDSRVPTAGTPGYSFDGTMLDGVDDICLYGGRSGAQGALPMTMFGDGIYDDITWTPSVPPCSPGDADGDGDVDLDDFVVLKQNFGATTGATCSTGDFDGDGDVDLDDFVILKQNFGM